jgi:hypothetical protein
MFHAVLAYLVKRDLKALLGLVNDLRVSSGDYDALVNVLRPRVERLNDGPKDQLRRLVDLQVKPVFAEVYVSIRTYRPTDPLPHKTRKTIYNTIVSDPSGTRSTVPIDWNMVGQLRKAFVEAFLEKGLSLDRLHIVIDVPFGKNARRMLFVRNEHGGPDFEITNVSHLDRSIFELPAIHLSPVRVYAAPEALRRCGDQLDSVIQSAESRFYSMEHIDTDGASEG